MKSAIPILCCLIASVLLPSFEVMAQLPDARPPVVRYTSDIEAYPQNFSIAVDQQGFVYVGNAEGVQIFDGEQWQEVVLPNGDIVRSLAYDNEARVYVGGFNEFGYVQRDDTGDFQYYSLTPLFAEELAIGNTSAGEPTTEPFADIWRICVSRQGVFFVGLEHLFLVNLPAESRSAEINSKKAFWKHDGSFGPIGEFREQVWLQWRGDGIKSYAGDGWTLHEHPTLARDFLVSLVPVSDELIVISNDGPWFRFDGSRFEEIPDSLTIPHKQSMTHGFLAGDQVIGVATQLGLIVFYDLKTGVADVFRVSDGFVSDVVKTSSGNVLSVDDLGFTSVRWPARWRSIDSRLGLTGSITAIRSHNDRTYVLTSSGAFATDPGYERFQRLSWTDYEAWDMLVLDSAEILFADSYEIKLIGTDGSIRSLDDNTTARVFKQSRFDPDLVYVGTEFGIQILKRSEEGWRSVLNKTDMTNLTVSQIVERSPEEIWIGTERGGIQRLEIESLNWKVHVTPVGAELGLEYGDRLEGAYLYEMNGKMLASTDKGLFRYNVEQFEPYQVGNSDVLNDTGRTLELASDGEDLWAFYYDRLFHLDELNRWTEEDISQLIKGAMTVIEFIDGRVLIGGMGSIMTYDGQASTHSHQAGQLKLTYAEVSGAERQPQRLPLSNISVSTADERLTLRYALTEFERPEAVRYRTRLAPVENAYSSWTDSGQQSFLNLQPGSYLLLVQASSDDDNLASLEVPFTVKPQWYETSMAQIVLFFLLMVLMYFAVRALAGRRTRLLKLENELLEQKVTERTRALQSANQQLDRMAHLDGLTQIPNRRRLDSYLEDVRMQCADRGRVMALALIDVDHFKRFNDTHGHQAGDTLLVELAKLLSRNLRRAEDLVARYGGEEFLVVLPGADAGSALEVIESMRRHVEESELGVTVSAGLHVHTPDQNTAVETMIEKADQALYSAKHAGRNRVVTG